MKWTHVCHEQVHMCGSWCGISDKNRMDAHTSAHVWYMVWHKVVLNVMACIELTSLANPNAMACKEITSLAKKLLFFSRSDSLWVTRLLPFGFFGAPLNSK